MQLPEATTSKLPNVFTFTLLLSDGRAGKAWEPSNKMMLFILTLQMDRRVVVLFVLYKSLFERWHESVCYVFWSDLLLNISGDTSDRCGTRYRSWLRHHATSRKVAGSVSDQVIGFFNWPNPSSRTMALVSTQPLTEISTRNLPEGKGRPAR
jgi:hypothetical protein